MTKFLKDLMKVSLAGMIAIDLQKAFHTIYHETLLSKLPLLGFSEAKLKKLCVSHLPHVKNKVHPAGRNFFFFCGNTVNQLRKPF